VQAAGRSATLVAEIDKGTITRLKLQGCAGCGQKDKKHPSNKVKKLFLAVRDEVLAIRSGEIKLPEPLGGNGGVSADIKIPIWPFPPIVIIVEGATDGFCIAIMVGSGKVGSNTVFCYACFGSETLANCLL
jgi:hypothetical protein